jgi:Rod binding domain-containing protein
MRIGPLYPPSASALDPSAAAPEAQAKGEDGHVDGKKAIDPEKLRLAQEFEQIFIRKMLSSLEKSGRSQAGASASSSGDAYGSMVVSALAEAVSKGGGVGLAEVIARAASQQVGPAAPAQGSSADPSVAAKATAAANVGSGIGAMAPSKIDAGAGATSAPHNVGIAAARNAPIPLAHPAKAVTYTRPTPPIILNENHDIQESFKDRKR